MKKRHIETYGVYIGFCVWFLGGWLIFTPKHEFVEWTWHYTNIRERLEDYWTNQPAGSLWT